MPTASRPAKAQNSPRQPICGNSHCTGSVEASMPSDPVISIQELARSCAASENRRRYSVSGAIRQAPTPAPISTRAAVSAVSPWAQAKAAQPSTAALSNTSSVHLGPQRSSALPSGSCMQAKPRKKAPDNKPKSAAFSPSSALNTGAKVAVTARSSADKK